MNLDNHQNRNFQEFSCDWRAGFQYHPQFRGRLGYLLDWSGCGNLALKRDLKLSAPLVGEKKVCGPSVKCVGVIDYLRYEGGAKGPIHLRAYVSRGSASNIRNHFTKPFSDLKLKLAWYIADYDTIGNRWFEAAHLKSPKVAEASIITTGGNPQVFLDHQPTRHSAETDLTFFGFEFHVVPANKKTAQLEFANGANERWVNTWGSTT